MRTLARRFAALFRRGRLERELDEEIRAHLDMLEEEFRVRGLDREAARQAALREFGGIDRTKEAYRDRRGLPWVEGLAKDIRHAARGMLRSPAFTLAAVLSLALGIGADTAIFSFVNALMLRELPSVDRPEQLTTLYRAGTAFPIGDSYLLYLKFRKQNEIFAGVAASSGARKARFQTGPGERPDFAHYSYVSGNYFQVLGVQPALGRLFTDEEDRIGNAVTVLSYELWRDRFGLDPGILGKTVQSDSRPFTVIGVAAPGFHGIDVESHCGLWLPLKTVPDSRFMVNPNWRWLRMIARMRPEVPQARVEAAVNTLMRAHWMSLAGSEFLRERWLKMAGSRYEMRNAGSGLSWLRGRAATPLSLLMTAVAMVLLVACANVANLLLARGAARRRETALRLSLGATRGRIVRGAFVESAMLAALGGCLGVLFATWGAGFMLTFLEDADLNVTPDAAVLSFAAAVSLLSALLFGIAPALRSCALDPAAALKQGASQAAGRVRWLSLRKGLVIVQVALSVVLVALAGLFGRSLAQVRSIDSGFRYQDLIAFSLDYPSGWTGRDQDLLRERLLDRIRHLPGVAAASFSAPGPYQNGSCDSVIQAPGGERVVVTEQAVGARYFETLGNPPFRGRDFDSGDTAAAPKVAIVNEAFVRRVLPGKANPAGETFRLDDPSDPEEHEPPMLIAGLVRDVLHGGVKNAAEPTVYIPFAQKRQPFLYLLVRAELPLKALLPPIRRELAQLAPEVIAVDARTIRNRIDTSIYLERMFATLSGFFGGLALLLASVGLYGVIAYSVVRRTGEIGIRMALGAGRRNVLWMVLREAVLLIAIGIAAGLPLSLAAGRLGSSLLYGIKPGDPLALASTAGVLIAAGLAAAYLPGRRAASIQPVEALRHE